MIYPVVNEDVDVGGGPSDDGGSTHSGGACDDSHGN